MALKQIIGLYILTALFSTSFSSPVAPGVRQYIPPGNCSSATIITVTSTIWSWSRISYPGTSTFVSSTASSNVGSSSTLATSSLVSTTASTIINNGSISSYTSQPSSVCTSACVSDTTTSNQVGPSNSNKIPPSTISSSLTSIGPYESTSLIVQTLTEPGESFITLTLPASASITGLETLTISGSVLIVEPSPIVSSGSMSLIVETLTEPNGPIVTLTLPTSEFVTGLETITLSGSTLTVEPISITSSVFSAQYTSVSNVESSTEPNGSSLVRTLPSALSLTGLQTITTKGQTLISQPIPTQTTSDIITATITTVPAGLFIQPYTNTPVRGNMWLTTTGSDSSTTIIPIILPCPTCAPQIIWNLPEVPNVEFSLPGFPKLPKFHLPCVKIFGITVSGSCSDPSGPTPQNDTPPESPEPSNTPTSTPTSGSSSPSSTDNSSSSSDSSNSSSASACSAILSVSVEETPPLLAAPTITLTPRLTSSSGRSRTTSQTSSTVVNANSSTSLSLTTSLTSSSTTLSISPWIVSITATGPSPTISPFLPPTLTFLSTSASATVVPMTSKSGSSCVSASTTTICEIPQEPCISSAVCNNWVATATSTSTSSSPPPPPKSTSSSPPTPTLEVVIDIYTDSNCVKMLEQVRLTEMNSCYTPAPLSNKAVPFKCFLITSIIAAGSASLTAFKVNGCFSQFDTETILYTNWTDIANHKESPFEMGSLAVFMA